MLASEERTRGRAEAPSRRVEEVRALEAIWSLSGPITTAKTKTPIAIPITPLALLYRYRISVSFVVAWVAFMTVLLALAPASDALTAPGWVKNVSGILATALMATPLGVLHRAIGYGAFTVAAGSGMALAISCFGAGHNGFWASYQLAGFSVLAVAGAAMVARTARG